MRSFLHRLALAYILLGYGYCVGAEDSLSIFDYLIDAKCDQIIIETDIKELFKKKDQYHEAKLHLLRGEDTILIHHGEIRSRGNARKEICVLPPTKLRFKKEWLSEQGLSAFATLKLVNACTLGERDRDYVLAEHLIYRCAAIISEYSFRTHPLVFHYRDSQGKRKPMTLKGFIIEHEDQMAKRHESKVYEIFFKKELLDRASYIRFAVFQYMIGNTDWKIINHHNLRVITSSSRKMAVPVPYDFDYAGLVKTHYAVPNSKLDIDAVTERLYLGPCQTKQEVESVRMYFLSKESKIMSVFQEADLAKFQAKFSLRYLEEFFNIIRDRKQAERIFTKCLDY